jgi:hypothetical protein
MALIAINGDYTIPQPSTLKEEVKQKVVDRTSIKGVMHRYWEAQKMQATMTFSALNQSQYTHLTGYFYNNGAAVTYSNASNGFSFTGFATVAEAIYIPGSLLLKDMDVTIVQQ